MARFSEQNGGLFRYEYFAQYKALVETPVSVDIAGFESTRTRRLAGTGGAVV